VGGRVLLTKMKMAFSGSSLMLRGRRGEVKGTKYTRQESIEHRAERKEMRGERRDKIQRRDERRTS
jgi:hypothetical protein